MLSSVIRVLLVLLALACTTARAAPLRLATEQVGPPFTTPLRAFDTAAAWLGALSADGQSLAVAHVDGRVRLWDVASGRRWQVFEGASAWIDRLALNAQGQPLAISRDATLRRWDPETGDLLATQRLPVPTSPNRASPLAFSPDGRFVVNLDPPKLWDTETGRERLQLKRVDAWAFSPDGGLWLNGAQLWDLATDRVLHTLGDPKAVWSVVFHPDGTQVLIGTEGGAQLWEAASGRRLHTFPAKGGVISAAFSPDGQRLLVQVPKGVDLWEKHAESGRWKRRSSKVGGGPVAFSADGRFIRTVARIDDSEDPYTRLWDAITGRRVESPLQSGALLSGRWLLSTLGGKIVLWDAPGAEPLRMFPPGVGPESLAVSTDGRQALVRAADDGAWLWDLASGRLLQVKEGRFGQALAGDFTPDGPRLLTVNAASTVELWDLAEPRRLQTLPGKWSGTLYLFDGGQLLMGTAPPRALDLRTGKRTPLQPDQATRLWSNEVVDGRTEDRTGCQGGRTALGGTVGLFDGRLRRCDATGAVVFEAWPGPKGQWVTRFADGRLLRADEAAVEVQSAEGRWAALPRPGS